MTNIFLVILVVLETARVLGFNLAPEFATVLSDPLKESNSYFGFTVQLYGSLRSDSFRIIVGAPKSKSVHHPNLERPGVVYECLLNGTLGECSQIKLEQSGEARYYDPNGYSYNDLKKNAWIGGALAVNADAGFTLVCGPGWKNQYHKDYYLMNGICYFLPNIKRNEVKDIQKLLPLLYQGSQGYKFNQTTADPTAQGVNEVFFYSYGEAGISVDAFENEFIIGAPGVFDWKGTVIRYQRLGSDDDDQKTLGNGFVPNPHFTKEIPLHAYMGYSVAHGRFFQDREKSYVAGAPRAGTYRGKVFIFKMGKTTEEPLQIEIRLEGRQMGEYFGASLCVIDLNKDGFDDILIGAPQHFTNDGDVSSDEGQVYVFINDKNGNLQEFETNLVGSKIPGARFGTAISAVGDLDRDGYPEIAVGAPYEKDLSSNSENTGAVYIYKGTSFGIAPKYSQKIHSSGLGYGIRGFGMSISKGLDVDGNYYNDVAVGAYESGHVFLIKARPVARFFHSVTWNVPHLQQNTTRFQLTICLRYEGHDLPKTLEVDVDVTLDKILKRARFELGDGAIIYRSVLTEKSNNCETKIVFFDPLKVSILKNRYAALPIALNYSLTTQKFQRFCKTCPVTDPSSDTYYLTRLPVMSKCDKISTCIPDWKISAEFHGIKVPFVIGSEDVVHLKVQIRNRGDTSTIDEFIVTLPEDFPLKIFPAKCNKMTKNSWRCLSDVIVPSDRQEALDLMLDATKAQAGSGEATFYFALSSVDEESENVNKNFTLRLPLKEESRIEVSAKAKPNVYVETAEDKKSVSLTHSYHVYNSGFTGIKNFRFRCLVPETISRKSSTRKIAEKHQLTATLNSDPIFCNENSFDSISNESRGISVVKGAFFIDCHKKGAECHAYDCQVPVLDSRSNGIHVEINISVLLEGIKSLFEEAFHVYYNTSFMVLNDEKHTENTAVTRFDRATIPEKIDPQFWLYIFLAIFFAIILLSAIIYLLYKRKFFERSRHPGGDEQLGNLINEVTIPDGEESAT